MLRRRLGVITGLCAVGGVLLALTPSAAAPAPASAQGASASVAGPPRALAAGTQPNIVLITADDMRADDLDFMPRTKKFLGRAGVTFTNALSNYPLCCPARATILTGQYPHNNGIKGNEWPEGGYKKFYLSGAEQETLPVWLQRAGYRTGFIGKYLNHYGSTDPNESTPGGATYVPPGWNDWRATVGHVMEYYCPTLNENGTRHRYRGHYQTDLYTQLGESFIESSVRRGKPFFLWASHLAPHLGHDRAKDDPCRSVNGAPAPPAQRHRGMFDGIDLPDFTAKSQPSYTRDESFNEPDMSDKGTYMRDRVPLDLAHQREVNESRLAALQALDESVGDTVDTLRAQGVLGNTMIVFASDNGWLFGEHRAEKKILPYEESLRVPIVVRGPGFPAGVRRPQPVGLVDIAATALDVSGAVATKAQDGVSLLGPAEDRTTLARRVMPIEAGPAPVMQGRYNTVIPDWYYRGARSERYSYIAWQMESSEEEELYDLAKDPFQLESSAGRPSDALDGMRQMSTSLRECKGSVPDAPGSCLQTMPAGVDLSMAGRVRTGDTAAPRISDVQAPKGWLGTTRPTIRYTASDPTDPAGKLRHWCSHQAIGCDGRATLQLRGEGRHDWTIHVTDPSGNVGSAFGRVLVDLYRPVVKAAAPALEVTDGSKAAVSWRVSDSGSGIRSTDTRRRTAPLDGDFTAWTYPAALQNRARPPRTTGVPTGHGTVCLQVRALDVAGRQVSWRGQLCRARAVDAAEVTTGPGWRTVQRDGWFAKTATVTKRRGAALAVPSRGGVGLVRLVARTGPGMGTLRVTVGDTVVARVNLDRSTRTLAAFRLRTPGLAGPVTATVVSAGKPVWVDSIGVVRRPGR